MIFFGFPEKCCNMGFMETVLIILIALVFFAALFQRLKFGTVLGYLGGGMLLGPYGLGVAENTEAISHLAEMGVVFLLFTLGLELKPDRLKLFGPKAYGIALAQFFGTAGIFIMIANGLGIKDESAVVIGCGLALSSTAVVLQVLKDLNKTVTQLGRLSIAILLVQDMAVGPLLVMVETFAHNDGDLTMTLIGAALKAVIVLVFVILIGRYLIRPLLGVAARTGVSEIFAGFTLVIVLGAAWITHSAGLSMALGAFVAGVMVADTEYHNQVAADISPFRGLLLGLFFMSVGMSMDFHLALREPLIVLAMTLGLMGTKALILIALGKGVKLENRLSLQLGGTLSQGSEFAFVLFGLAFSLGIMEGRNAQLLTIVVVLSMITTLVGTVIARRKMEQSGQKSLGSLQELDEETAGSHGHVLVVGFGKVGKAVTRHLVGMDVPVLVLDYDARRVSASKEHNLPVFYGNAERLDVLRAVHIEQASLIILAVREADTAISIISLIKRTCPNAHIMTRAADDDEARRLIKAGAEAAAVDGLTTAMELAERAVMVFEPNAVMAGEASPAPADASER